MKGITVITMGVLLFSSLSAATQKIYHYPQAEALPDDSTTIFPRDPALLTSQNVNLTGDQFLASWHNWENERERIKADMYLLGVLDATEGKLWCGYHRVKSISIHEYLNYFFDKLPKERLKKERASDLIIEAMTINRRGCRN
jgi:SRSO17 transposase